MQEGNFFLFRRPDYSLHITYCLLPIAHCPLPTSTPGAPRHPRQRGICCAFAENLTPAVYYPPLDGVVPTKEGSGEDSRLTFHVSRFTSHVSRLTSANSPKRNE